MRRGITIALDIYQQPRQKRDNAKGIRGRFLMYVGGIDWYYNHLIDE